MVALWKSERPEQSKHSQDKRAEKWEIGKVMDLDKGHMPDCRCHEERQVETSKRAQE